MQNDNRQTINLTTVDHYAEAERLAARSESWRDFDRWTMTSEDRIGLATVDGLLAQAHATLALTDATRRVADDEDKIAGVIDGEQRTLRVAMKP